MGTVAWDSVDKGDALSDGCHYVGTRGCNHDKTILLISSF